jgi:prepilin peptidase CpaA
MVHPFFSDAVFGWIFYGILVAITVLASYTDFRSRIVPKWLTIGALGLGVVMNIVRGALLGAHHQELWALETGSAWLGGLDGLLFSLTGVLVGFGVFFGMWVLGTCGGGDVKLFTALGAWIGWWLMLHVMLASVVFLAVMILIKMLTGGVSFQRIQKNIKPARKDSKRGPAAAAPRRSRLRLTYSFPAALATALLLLWFFRVELELACPKPQPHNKVQAYAN